MFVILCFIIVLLSCESSSRIGNTSRRFWSYDDQRSWPGHMCKGGTRQSPVDVRDEDVLVDWDGVFIRGPLELRGYKSVLLTGVNNGFTIQLSADGEHAMHPLLMGGPLQHEYRLEQVHFHWMSEHSINGRKYPMEIHFVHVRKDLTVSEALRQKGGLAIVAVMCHVKSWLTEKDSDPLNQVIEILPALKTRGSRHSGLVLDLMSIISPGSKSFYAYSGSLTSPECNEVVTWIIYDKPIHMSAYQHSRFTEMSRLKNFRDIQPIQNIVVYRIKPESIFEKPAIVSAFDSIYQGFKGFISDIKRVIKQI